MAKRIYVLQVSANREISLQIDVLGKILFEKGLYTYVSSAQNDFGSSNCKCESHLFRLKDYQSLRGFMQEMTL